MRYFKLEKLVRDKIPGKIKKLNELIYGYRKLDDDSFVRELIKKLLEESREIQTSFDRDEIASEISDIQEIIDYIKSALKISDDEIKFSQKQKCDKNGGFKDKHYIESVGLEEDDDWVDYYLKKPDVFPEIEKPE